MEGILGKEPRVMDTLSIRRAQPLEADKVRYRVYRTPSDFVVVIAESALVAVKVAGVKNPHKVVRDLLTDGIAVEPRKIAPADHSNPRVSFPLTQSDIQNKALQTEMHEAKPAAPFVPMGIADLRHAGGVRARILPPEMLYQIIEEHTKATASHATAPPEAEAAAPPPPEPAPPPPPEPPVPTISPQEKLLQMAEELLPPSESVTTPPPAAEPIILSPDEVAKLLNE